MASVVRSGQRLAKGVTACQRCRRRKQKCDLKYPNCSNCAGAQVVCLTYHSEKQHEIPRSYVTNLESQVEELTKENRDLRTQIKHLKATRGEGAISRSSAISSREGVGTFSIQQSSAESAPSNSNHLHSLVSSVRNVVAEPSRQPFIGASSGITLAKMVMSAIRTEALPSALVPDKRPVDHVVPMAVAEVSLPPRQAADHLVEVYFQYRTAHLPIIERSQVELAVDGAYRALADQDLDDAKAKKDLFTTYMIFAIALRDVANPTGVGRPSQSEGCFRSATMWIEDVMTYSKTDIETLRTILLLAQFVALCPSQGSLWHLAGFALRLCIDIGMHWESEEQTRNRDPDILHERRRLWYATYQLDRSLCITLGRPFGIIEQSIQVPLPNAAISRKSVGREPYAYDVHNQLAHNHIFAMSKLESEIKHVLHSQTWDESIASPRVNYSEWIELIKGRLQQWYEFIPQPIRAHPSSIFACPAYWDTIYHTAVLILYQPGAIVLPTSTEEMIISFEASCKLITSIKTLQREGKIDVMWKSVHALFKAGLGVIYGLWQSREIRQQHPASKSISTLQSCASTLSALSESYPGATGCRDAFDTLSSATIDFIVGHREGSIAEDLADFEKQMDVLMQQVMQSRGSLIDSDGDGVNLMSTLLSTDSLVCGEMLNSAAQWPQHYSLNFSAFEPEFVGLL